LEWWVKWISPHGYTHNCLCTLQSIEWITFKSVFCMFLFTLKSYCPSQYPCKGARIQFAILNLINGNKCFSVHIWTWRANINAVQVIQRREWLCFGESRDLSWVLYSKNGNRIRILYEQHWINEGDLICRNSAEFLAQNTLRPCRCRLLNYLCC